MTDGEILWTEMAENLLMWAVPMFLMITGALLLDPAREVTARKLFGKYLRRIVLALVCFTLLFQILECTVEASGEPLITGWLHRLLNGQSWAHMWYLYLMISIYLLIPVYRAIAGNLSDRWMLYFINILLLFTSIGPLLAALGFSIDAFAIPVSTVYPVYLFLGYYFYNHRLSRTNAVIMAVFCTAVIILARAVSGNYASDSEMTEVLSMIPAYSSIFVVGQSLGLFSLLVSIDWKESAAVKNIDSCTFGIYLIHMIGIRALMKWAGFDPFDYGPFCFIALTAVLFAVSYLVTWAIRKIPRLDLL